MQRGLLIRGARQLLTLRGPSGPRRGPDLLDLEIIPDGAVLIRNQVIEALGTSRQVVSLAAARNCEEIDATGKVVMPAFVDLEASLVHAHPSARSVERIHQHYGDPDVELFRDVLRDGARGLTSLSAQSLRKRAIETAVTMAEHGTCTVESRAGYTLNASAAMKVLRVQNELEAPPHVISTALLSLPPGEDPNTWAASMCDVFLPAVRSRRLAKFVDLEYDARSLPPGVAMRVFEACAGLQLPLKIHASLFAQGSAVPVAVQANATSVGHLHRVVPDELDFLANASTVAVLNPGLDLQMGINASVSGREMIDAGVIPALACGYHPELSPGCSMQLMLFLACRVHRLQPEEAITAATVNNAHALRIEQSLGSLAAGKQADLLILDVPDYQEVAYYPGLNMVSNVIKKGRVLEAPSKRSALSLD